MANTQINITKNGTTTLATAGKYCDRNIDVNVDVPEKATKFTNLYNPANVVLKTSSNCTSGVVSFNADNYVNYVIIPFHHVANGEVAIRARGLSIPVRDRNNFTCFGEDGTKVVTWGQLSSIITIAYDEYGDQVMTFKSGAHKANEWYYLHLNFQYQGVNGSASEAFTGPIITINEPIGNGGYGENVGYTNLLDLSTTQINTRMKSDGINTAECPGLIATDYIDLGDAMAGGEENILHAKGFRFHVGVYKDQFTYVHYYDKEKALLGKIENTNGTDTYDTDGNPCFELDAQYTTARYVRVTGYVSDTAITQDDIADAILTLNELIGA